ncbi:Ig-like domain-containing protein [Chitinophaga caseinilytica]|uniref:Ig-like domain-containing protein n=1 Tax=Chitinophaga caseinilytica TaxID=2267521 RepID=A0ABZ2YVU3_9BACT
MKKILSLFVLLFLTLPMMAADFYWVAGSGSWSNLNNWRLGSPTGSIPAFVPTSNDNVIFGTGAGNAGAWVVTVDANVFCNNFTWMPGLPGTPRINRTNNSFIISVSGNVTIQPNVAYDAMQIDMVGGVNATVTANGPANVNMGFYIRKTGGAVVTFTDDYVAKVLYSRNVISLVTGGLNVANRKIGMYSFGTDQPGTRTLDITNATLDLAYMYSALGSGLTLSATGSKIFTNRFYSDAGVYNEVQIRNTSKDEHAIVGSTFRKLEFMNAIANSEARIASGNTIDTLIFNGTGSIRASLNNVKYALFKMGGYFGGTGNTVQYAEVNGAFSVIDNGTHTLDTLITTPNKNITIAGTLNINKLLRAGGTPCNGFTEITGSSSGTFNLAAGTVVDIDNVLLTNMTVAGPMTPVTVNGIDNDGNTGWNIVQPSAPGTTLYWVGGAGDWNDNAHWSTASGGPGGACIPFINDNVVFDAGSGFAAGNNVVTTSANTYCKDMTWSGVAASPVFNETTAFNLKVYGSLVLDPSVTMNAILFMHGEADATVTTNGATIGKLGFNIRKFRSGFQATVTFTDNWTNPNGAIAVPRGGIDLTNRTLNINTFSSGGALGRYIQIENATILVNDWTVIGIGHIVTSTNSYIRAATGFTSYLQTYNDVEVLATGELAMEIVSTNFGWLTFSNTSVTSGARILGNNTIRRLEFKGKAQIRNTNNNIDSLILAPNRNFNLLDATTTKVNKYFRSVHPACSGLGEIRSGNAAISTLNFGANATVEIENVYMENVAATGGGGSLTLPIPFNGANAGGNSGWTISPAAAGDRYWVGGAGDWNDASHWSNTSGGSGGACIPTASNDVYFDANSGFTAASKTVTIVQGNAYFRNMDWTGAPNSPLLDKNNTWVAECWGNLVLNPNAFINGQIRMMGANSATIAGSTKGNFDIDVRKTSGAGVSLLNDFNNANSNFRLTTGGFNIAGKTINVTSISNFGIDGNIQLDISDANISAINFQYYGGFVNRTVNAANSRITGSVILHGGTYNYISIPGTLAGNCQLTSATADSLIFTNPHNASAVGINGNNNNLNYVEYKGSGAIYGTGNTMGTLVFFPGNIYRLNGGSTNTITGNWFGSGTPCRLTEIRSSTAAQATVVKTSGNVTFDYVRLERSRATGGATFTAKSHSDDLGGNSGWTIEPKDGVTGILGLGPDQELCASAFPHTLNTTGFFGAPGSVYTWSDGSNGETLSVTTPGTYRISVTFPDGCNVKDTIKITQAVVPVDPIAGDAGICVGETKTLTNTTPGGVWTTSDPALATVDASGIVTGVADGNVTITYTVTSGAGCVNAVTHALTVNALPTVAAITGTPDVCVGGTTLLANTTAGGTWKSGNTGVATISAGGTVTGVAAGTAIITYEVTSAAGCKSSQTINITVNDLPVVPAITGTTSVCTGGTTTLANAMAGGVWTSTNIGVAAVDPVTGVVTGMGVGTADITYTVMNPEGCSAGKTITVTVSLPPAVAPVTGITTVCIGGNTTLSSATPGGTWSSSDNAIATIDGSGIVTGVSAGSVTITYTVTLPGGCVSTQSATVTMSAPPTVGAISGTTAVCVGEQTALSSATPGGVWSSLNTAVATIDNSGNVTGIAAGTAVIQYTITNGTGCAATQSATVTVSGKTYVAPISGTNTVCLGDHTYLTNATSGGIWASSNISVASIDPTGLVTGSIPGTATITYTVTNVNGCATVRSTLFTVNTPLLVAPITGSNTVCIGGTTPLASTTTGGSWSSSDPTVALINANGEVTGVTQGNVIITYEVSNSASCNASVTFNLAVQSPTVVAPITGTTGVCIGGQSTLANATPAGDWSSSNTAVATIDASGVVTGISDGTTTITYTVTEASGCKSIQTATFTVHPLPTVDPVGGVTDVCVGANTTLSSATAGGNWSSSNTAVATVDAFGEVTGVSAGTAIITYEVTSGAGCTSSQVATITVHALPGAGTITGITDVCAGLTTDLDNATPNGTWTSSNTAVATVDVNGIVTGLTSGTTTITYTVTNASGCEATATATVTVHALPNAGTITGTMNVCTGLTTDLDNAVPGGVWASSNTAVATVDANGLVTGVASGTATITYEVTSAAGCISTQQVTVTVNARPAVSPVLGVASVCIGGTTTLSNATPLGVWSTSDAAVATIDAGGEVTGVSAGTATITYTVTNAAGCVSARTAIVTVNALPNVSAITGVTDMCAGAGTTLSSATPGGTWSSSSTLVATVNASGEVLGVSAGTAVITYSVTNGAGCESTRTITVTVNALPAIAPITGTTDVCVTGTTDLASATPGGVWATSDAAVATVDADGKVTGVTDGTVTITYTVTNVSGCEDVQMATVTVNALPVVDQITGSTAVCEGSTTELENATAGGVWTSSNTAVATIDANGVVTGLTAGTTTITYTVTNPSGCEAARTFTFTVNGMPVMAPITGTNDVCVAGTTDLDNTTPGGVWASLNTGVAMIDANGVVTGVSTGTATITYTVTTAAGCVSAESMTVTVNALPSAGAITGTTDVCIGLTTDLDNAAPGGVWTSSNTAVATVDANGIVTGLTAGTSTITYTVTSTSGCVSTTTATITVNALPSAGAITGTTDVCIGLTTDLDNAAPGGVWTSSNTAVATVDANGIVTGLTAGTSTITYTVTSTSGCVSITTAAVTVNAMPNAGTITGTTDVCIGLTTDLDNAAPGGVWTSSNTAVATVDANGIVTGLTAGTSTITYTVTSTSGCVSTTTAAVTVNALPNAGAITGTTDVCIGLTTDLDNVAPGGVWTSSNIAVATVDANGIVTGVTAGTSTITYTVTSVSGCVSTTTTIVTVNALPNAGAITGTTDVCAGLTTDLDNAAPGGVWTSSNTAVATVDANGIVTGLTAGTSTITYTVTSTSGCVSTTTATITVNILPNAGTITGTTDVCIGLTTDLDNAAPGGVWTSSNTAVATVDANGIVTGVTAGTSTITYTVTSVSGCVSTTTTIVTVNALPNAGAITGTTDVCVGLTTDLDNVAPGGVWTSSNTAMATVDANGIVTGVTAGTSTITYTVTSVSGCVSTTTTIVTVNALPNAGAITGTTDVCIGLTTDLDNAAPGGVWTSSNTAVATVDANGIVTGITAGTSTITYTVTSVSGCVSTTTTIVTVNALPNAGTITGTTDVCVGLTTDLDNVAPGGVWTSSNTTVATADANGIVTGLTAGTSTITYTVTSTSGCVSTTTATITVNALPNAGTITGTPDVCIGLTTDLDNVVPGGVWTSSNTAVATVDANGIVTGLTAGTSTITYTVTSTSGCVSTTTATITVNALPNAGTITGTTDVCVGLTTDLDNVAPGGVWTSSNTTVATVDANGIVTGLTAGTSTITYTVTSTSGCVSTTTATVTVNALPNAGAITGALDVCVGLTTDLDNAAPGGVWTSSNTAVATVDANGIVTGITAGTSTITYTVTSTSGCVSSTTAFVTVNALPNAGTITGTTDVCIGLTTDLDNAAPGGVWTSSNTTVATVDANGIVTGITAGTSTITYTVTSVSGCVSTTTTIVTVNALPNAGTITGTTDVCIGLTTDLDNVAPGGVWTSSNTAVATVDANGIVTGLTAGTSTITYTVTSTSGCVSTTTSTITVNILPNAGAITGTTDVCIGLTTDLDNIAPGGVWTSSNTAVATVDANGIVTGITAGTSTITYTVTSTSGCVSTTTTIVTVNALPNAGAITGTTDVCAGLTTDLDNAAPGGVWTSSNRAVATVDANGIVTGVTAGTSTITYTVTSVSGCVSTTTTIVTVNALPNAGAITGTTEVCAGLTTDLDNAAPGGVWTSSNTAVATVDANGIVTGLTVGTSTITYTVTSTSGCVSTTTATITVNALPNAGTITGTTDVCIGLTTDLDNVAPGGVWTSSNTAVATVDANGIVTGLTAGTSTITYTVTSTSGCVSTTTTIVTVDALPNAGTITGTTDVCVGLTTDLDNVAPGGVWTSSNTAVATVDANGIVTGVTTGTSTITYTVTSTSGCVSTTTATFTVNALPNAGTITGTTDVCVGLTTDLDNAVPGGVWTSSNTAVATVDANGIVTGLTAGTSTITYTVTSTSGCVSTTTATITVNALPSAGAITGTTDVCVGLTTDLDNAAPGGVWTSSNTAVATVDANGIVTGVTAGTSTITYTVTSVSGCVSTTTTIVTVNALPNAGAITGTTDVCAGLTTDLDNAAPGGVWTSSNTAVATVDANGIVTGLTAGTSTITYTVTSTSGCVSITTAAVTVNALPNAGTITGTTDVCIGLTTDLDNAAPGGVWTSSNMAVATVDANGIVTGLTAGTSTITYTVTSTSGCVSTSTATITVNALPNAGTITGTTDVCVGLTTDLDNATPGGVWTSSNTAMATVDANGIVTGITAGTSTITYTVTSTSGCVSTTTTVVTVNALPNAGAITGTTDVCIGLTTDLDNAAPGGVWVSSNTTVATVDANGIVTGLTAGASTITYTVTSTSGCVSTTTATITVNALPNAGTITGTTDVCIGLTTDLDNVAPGGVWTSSNTAIATVDANGLVTGLSAGTTTITYTVTNTGGCAASKSIVISVKACTPQVPPVATDDQARTYQAQPVNINVIANDTQANGAIDVATVTVQAQPANGTVTVSANGIVRYTPAPGFTGTDRFTYIVRNTGNLPSNIATVTINVDIMPVAVNDTLNTRPDQRTQIPVLTNDKGAIDPASIVISRQPARGTVTINPDGTVTFAPLPGFKGAEEFRYRMRDVHGTLSNEAVVRIYVGEEDFFIPNAITPNGDGINDRFVIPDLHKFQRVSLTVFNRWGNEVYHKALYDNRWDGNGLSGGTYYYILKVETPQGPKVIKGWIQLLK